MSRKMPTMNHSGVTEPFSQLNIRNSHTPKKKIWDYLWTALKIARKLTCFPALSLDSIAQRKVFETQVCTHNERKIKSKKKILSKLIINESFFHTWGSNRLRQNWNRRGGKSVQIFCASDFYTFFRILWTEMKYVKEIILLCVRIIHTNFPALSLVFL